MDADRAREADRANTPVVTAGTGTADPERAAYAMTMKFPANAKVLNEVPLTASIDRERNELVIGNDSDLAINNANVWIDGKYVAWVGTIPAHERSSLKMASFSDAGGHTIRDWTEANAVQVQSGDRVFNTT